MEGGSLPASALDPYTRLLAWFADTVTKLRGYFPTTVTGKLIIYTLAWLAVSVVGVVIMCTSVIWVPILILTLTFYSSLEAFRFIQENMEDWLVSAKQIWFTHVVAFFSGPSKANAKEERMQRKQREAAIQDRRFLRGIFEALPGVDSERALSQAENLRSAENADSDSVGTLLSHYATAPNRREKRQ